MVQSALFGGAISDQGELSVRLGRYLPGWSAKL